MARELRFGIMTLQSVSWPTLVERWQLLDTWGFDSAWVADHFVTSQRPSAPWFEGWTLLAALAARTGRIRLGTMVTTITYRNPAILAREALTVDHISNGRLELGIGAGGNPRDHTMTGVEIWDTRERVKRFREVVEIVDTMLRNEVTTYQGSYYQIKDAEMHPAPIQQPRPPLTLAALGPTTIKLAAKYADSWNSYVIPPISVEEALDLTRQRNTMLDGYCAQIGRDPAEITRSLLVWPFVPDAPFDSKDAFHDFVGRYREIGIDEFIFYWLREDMAEFSADRSWFARTADRDTLEWLVTEAIPTLRATGPQGPDRSTGSQAIESVM